MVRCPAPCLFTVPYFCVLPMTAVFLDSSVRNWILCASVFYRAVLGIVIQSVRLSVRPSVCLSLCPSVTRALCDETKEHTAEMLILHERVVNLVFWHRKRLVGDCPFHLKFALKMTRPLWKTPTSTNIGLYRVAHKKRPELCVTITVRIPYGEKFPFAYL